MAWGDNERIVKDYGDKSYFTFSEGNKDSWHLKYYDNYGSHELYDRDYFFRIKQYGAKFGNKKVYDAFVEVFNLVTKNSRNNFGKPIQNNQDFDSIKRIANNLESNNLSIEKLFDLFYLTMISEFYYEHTKLFHRVKRLGVYQVLFKNMVPEDAANYSKNKSYKQLDYEMKQYNF